MNIFTKDDYRKIQAWLKANSIKDSDLTSVNDTIPEEDTLVLVQKINGILSNVKISIKNLLNSALSKVIIDAIIANAVKVNNTLTVTASNVKINNEKGTTLQDVLNYFEDNKLNRHTDDTFDGNLTVKKNITIEGNIKSHDDTITVEADLESTGEITNGQGNMLSDVNSAAKGWKIEYQDPQQDEPTVRAKYVLKDYRGVPKGNVIKIYKDSAITNVYLGTTNDTCNPDTGEVTKKPIHDNNEALSIVYRLDTGKYMLVNVPLGVFIREAEFDKYRGLGITENGQVFIKLASDVESSNYLHFNDSGELSADGIENRILRDLGTIINSVAGDSTMWGQYKKEEGTKNSSINEPSRWGQYKQAEANRNELLNTVSSKVNQLEQEQIQGGVYDVSAHNDGVVFESLQDLLSSSNLSTLIPTSVRKGGMTIRFIQGSEQSSDNKYVQYRLMSQNWSTVETDWQGVDTMPISNSKNIVESGGVKLELDSISKRMFYPVKNNFKPYFIITDGTFSTKEAPPHCYIHVKGGEEFLLKKIGSDNLRYAFATSNSSMPGGVIPLVSGHSVVEVSSDITVTIPDGCSYLLYSKAIAYKYTESILESVERKIGVINYAEESLVNYNQYVNGRTGELSNRNYRACTDYIYIHGMTILNLPVCGADDLGGYAFYNENKEYVSGESFSNSYHENRKNIIVQSNAYYIRTTWYSPDDLPVFKKFEINLTTVQTDSTLSKSGVPADAKTIGDMFSGLKVKEYDKNSLIYDNFAIYSGVQTSRIYRSCTDFIPVNTGCTISFMVHGVTDTNVDVGGYAFYDKNKNVVFLSNLSNGQYEYKHIQVPENAVYFRTTWADLNSLTNYPEFYIKVYDLSSAILEIKNGSDFLKRDILIRGGINSTNGSFSGSGNGCTPMIPVYGINYISFMSSRMNDNINGYAFYDKEGQFICGGKCIFLFKEFENIKVPDNAYFFRTNYYNDKTSSSFSCYPDFYIKFNTSVKESFDNISNGTDIIRSLDELHILSIDRAWEQISKFSNPPTQYIDVYGNYPDPLVTYDGYAVTNETEWEDRKAEILTKWRGFLGTWPTQHDTTQEFTIISSERRKGYTFNVVSFVWIPGKTIQAYLLVPDPDIQQGRLDETHRPAIITFGYNPNHLCGLERQEGWHSLTALEAVKRGYISLALGYFGGEHGDFYYPSVSSPTNQPLSMMAYAAVSAYYCLSNFDGVDSTKIGLSGLSYSSKWAMFASCLSELFACAVWSDGGITLENGDNYYDVWYLGTKTNDCPNGAYQAIVDEGLDFTELISLMYPRPVLITGSPQYDKMNSWTALNYIKRQYHILGNGKYDDRVLFIERCQHHETDLSQRQQFWFFDKYLKSVNEL